MVPAQLPARERRVVRGALLVSFGAALVLGVALAVRKDWPLAALVPGAALVLTVGLAELLARRGLPTRWLVAVALLNALTLVPELALRLADWSHGPRMEFGFPDPKTIQSFARDPELFWKHDPSRPGIDSLGFRGREIVFPKPADELRVVFLGDSVSAIGQPECYPMIVEHRLNAAPRADGRRYEVVNLSVPGYSSYQGRVLARRYAGRIGADLVFVYYGWNDHWQAYGATDEEKVLAPRSKRLDALADQLRILQLVRAAASSLRPGAGKAIGEVRVPRERYRENLEAILAAFRDAGAPVVFVTAPTTFYRSGVPAPLLEKGFVESAKDALALHRAYAETTRAVAAEPGARLLDLERDWDELPELPRLFLDDAIHLTAEGRSRMADEMVRVVREVLPP